MNFVKAAAFVSVVIVALYVGLTWNWSRPNVSAVSSQSQSAPIIKPKSPKQISHTVSFMPEQYVNIENRNFRKVEIHSQFPIRVASGDCHLDYGVEFVCDGDPADIFITDMRQRPIFTTPKGNLVTLTLIEY